MADETHEYLFDVKLFAAIRVHAASEAEARQRLAKLVECSALEISSGDDCLSGEVSLSADGEPDLIEVDGQDPDDI